jgi:tetratricopeptide (TPR) repeat protein
LTPQISERNPEFTSWILLFPATDCWQQGHAQEAAKELSQVAKIARSVPVEVRDTYLEGVGLSYITLGKLRTVEGLLNSLTNPDWRNFDLAMLALARDDLVSLRKYSGRLGGGGDLLDTSVPPILMARAGLLAEAQRGIARRSTEWRDDPDPLILGVVKVMKGELALAQGETTRAIALLQEGLQAINRSGTFTFFLGAEALARAWERKGNPQEAIGVLEKASAERLRGTIVKGFAWMRIQRRLVYLYRKAGREQDAQRIEAELVNLLATADPDFPLLVQLQASQRLAAAQAGK